MKKYFMLLALVALGFEAFSQLKPKSKDWFFYDLSHVTYLNAPSGMEQAWYSNGHNLTLMWDWMPSKSFGIGYGIGFNSENFYNNMRVSTVERTGKETYTLMDDTAYTSNEQTMQYIQIPLELRFRSKTNDKGKFFRFYVGAKIGVRIYAYADYESDNIHERYFSLDDLSRFRGDAYLRIGYGYLSLFASYGFTELYEDGVTFNTTDSGIEVSQLRNVRPLSIGVSLNL